MSRMPATIEFEIETKEELREKHSLGLSRRLLAMADGLRREIAARAALRRLHRQAAADPGFLKDIGASQAAAEHLVRHGQRRRR